MKKCFVAYNTNIEIRNLSSSGGVFFSLANRILKGGGEIAAPVFDKDINLKHILIKDLNDLMKGLGSKYVQSDMSQIYSEIKRRLDKNVKILFSGTPCQVFGLKKFLSYDYDNLICIDLICHGVPSVKFWNKYKFYLENEFGSSINKVEFRNKEYGWPDFCIKISFENGNVYKVHHDLEPYFLMFRDNYILKDSCYNCVCKGDKSLSDITIGDAWGTEKYKDQQQKGLSYVICNTKKGYDFFVEEESLFHQEEEIEKILLSHKYYYNSVNSDNKISFIENESWTDIFKKYKFVERIKYDAIPKDKNIIPWGAGNIFKTFAPELIRRCGVRVVCDSNADFWGKEIYPGITCISPKEAIKSDSTAIVICVESKMIQHEICEFLNSVGFTDKYLYTELLK